MVKLKGRHVYLDANTVIYALEGMSQLDNLAMEAISPAVLEKAIELRAR